MRKEMLDHMFPVGTRIELISMSGEPQMLRGLIGTVTGIDDFDQVHVRWENGSSLALVPDLDDYLILNK